jgi:hypothetical protein
MALAFGPTINPRPLSPSTVAVVLLLTVLRTWGRGLISPACSSVKYACKRATPCESMPLWSAITSSCPARTASSRRQPQRTNTSAQNCSSRPTCTSTVSLSFVRASTVAGAAPCASSVPPWLLPAPLSRRCCVRHTTEARTAPDAAKISSRVVAMTGDGCEPRGVVGGVYRTPYSCTYGRAPVHLTCPPVLREEATRISRLETENYSTRWLQPIRMTN